jgi:hypothetical protein
MEHDPNPPGQLLRAFNVSNGDILWEYPATTQSHVHRLAIADGCLFLPDGYTNQLITFGKGPTALEVSVDDTRIAKGDYTWITGKVTDQSPAQKDSPAVAKESMQAVMRGLHAGEAMPVDVTGVPVTLYSEDSFGSLSEIGSTITDGATGLFTYMWTPPNEDLYKITAVFAGDESYWDSWALTTLAVGPAASVLSTSSQTTATITISSLAAVVIGAVVVQKRHSKNKREEIEQ